MVPEHTRLAQPVLRGTHAGQPVAYMVLVSVQRAVGVVGYGGARGPAIARVPQNRLAILAATVRDALSAGQRPKVRQFQRQDARLAQPGDGRVAEEFDEGDLDERVSVN